MKKMISVENLMIALIILVMFILGSIAVLGIFSAPTDDNPHWFTALFVSKAIGFGAAYLLYLIIKKIKEA